MSAWTGLMELTLSKVSFISTSLFTLGLHLFSLWPTQLASRKTREIVFHCYVFVWRHLAYKWNHSHWILEYLTGLIQLTFSWLRFFCSKNKKQIQNYIILTIVAIKETSNRASFFNIYRVLKRIYNRLRLTLTLVFDNSFFIYLQDSGFFVLKENQLTLPTFWLF